jgi:hypothetical protein
MKGRQEEIKVAWPASSSRQWKAPYVLTARLIKDSIGEKLMSG